MRTARQFCLFLLIGIYLGSAVASAQLAKDVFSTQRLPSDDPPSALGSYAKGCLAGAVELPETGPGWQAMRLGRNRNWAHPAMIDFVGRLSTAAEPFGWPRLYIGDISQPRGGPMPGGHRSHQIGLDADIWLRVPGAEELSLRQREKTSSTWLVRPDRMAVNANWRPEHLALIRLAARDPAVARIFVNAAIKRELCRVEPVESRDWLRKVRAWWGHESHFHARLSCPDDAAGCVDQAPPPAGDGCGAELDWWFTAEALHPKPPAKPRVDLTMADLPLACRASVLQ